MSIPAYMQQPIPKPQIPFPYVNIYGSGGLESGENFFIMAFGKCAEGEETWQNKDEYSDTAPLPKLYCQFRMEEKQDEKNKYVRWIYTGANDPVHVLGLDRRDQANLKDRLKQIYGENAPRYPRAQPEVEYILPVFRVEKVGKHFDIDNASPVLLIIRQNSLFDIIEAAKNFSTQSDPSIYGRILEINKNLNNPDPKKKYAFKILFADPYDLSSREDEIKAMREKAAADIDKVYKEANGGSYDPENVWAYLLTHFGGTREELIAKYSLNVGPTHVYSNVEEVAI